MSPMRGDGGDAAVKLVGVLLLIGGFLAVSWIGGIAFIQCVSG